jgi:hypothetical protein
MLVTSLHEFTPKDNKTNIRITYTYHAAEKKASSISTKFSVWKTARTIASIGMTRIFYSLESTSPLNDLVDKQKFKGYPVKKLDGLF